jgi:hypothetical protein
LFVQHVHSNVAHVLGRRSPGGGGGSDTGSITTTTTKTTTSTTTTTLGWGSSDISHSSWAGLRRRKRRGHMRGLPSDSPILTPRPARSTGRRGRGPKWRWRRWCRKWRLHLDNGDAGRSEPRLEQRRAPPRSLRAREPPARNALD